jgi:hypothetical protein
VVDAHAGHTARRALRFSSNELQSDQHSLRLILTRPDHPEVRLLDGSLRKIPAHQALRLAERGHYEWAGTKHRVRKMRAMQPVNIWRACYRTTAAPTLQPSLDWLWNYRARPRLTE